MVVNYEQLLRAVFSYFHGQKFDFLFFLHCSIRTKKLLKIKVLKKVKNFGKYFFALIKNWFFRVACFGYRVKGVCLLLPSLVSLVSRDFSNTISQKS
jgi:hypothetical protein